MNTITKECRKESYILRPFTRQANILDVMGNREMTAREICNEMGMVDMNYVRPRLTELVEKGFIEVTGKARDGFTNRTVSVFKVAR